MKYFRIVFIVLLITLLGLTACSETNVGDPVEANHFSAIPTPVPGKAVIYGVIIDTITGQPISGVPFLARALVSDNPDLPITISFSYQRDPGANYDDQTGVFIFENIDPGDNYVIIVVTGPGTSYVVKEPDTDQPLILAISADEALNLEIIKIKEQ